MFNKYDDFWKVLYNYIPVVKKEKLTVVNWMYAGMVT